MAINATSKRPTSMKKRRSQQKTTLGRIVVHLGALIPLMYLYYQWYDYSLIDEINEITQFTGKGGIIFLMLTLLVTPLITIFNWRSLAPLRKPLGMYSFLYICIHLSIFIVPIAQIAPDEIITELFRKKYALVGMAAFGLMIPLAITSNKYSMKKLKRNWKTLHKLIYAIGVLAVVHYFWLVKAGAYRKPTIFALILFVLLFLRLPTVKKWIINQRKAIQKRRKS